MRPIGNEPDAPLVRLAPPRFAVLDETAVNCLRPGGARKCEIRPERAHKGKAFTPVSSCTSRRTADTANMPPKPVRILLPITANPYLSLTNL